MEDNKNNQGLFVKLGIAVIVVILLVVWVTNLKNVWQDAALKSAATDNVEWGDFREELDRSFSNVKEILEKKEAASSSEELIPLAAPVIDNRDEQILDDLLRKTVELATSTATSVPPVRVDKNCPAWINCMPMIGGPGYSSGGCSIPPGCEGITEIVY